MTTEFCIVCARYDLLIPVSPGNDVCKTCLDLALLAVVEEHKRARETTLAAVAAHPPGPIRHPVATAKARGAA